jgi:predicted acyl esterase
MMDGYEGAAGPLDPAEYGDRYVMIHASIRGTGCSGGRFDLFDRRSALDGREIIDRWIAAQSWSNGDVGIIGHSYPGLTGFLVASTRPDHLRAIAVSGLVDDLYRGISYIGGVPDPGFPLLWPTVLRPEQEQQPNAFLYVSRTRSRDATCARNIATRPPPNVLDDPVVNGAAAREDGPWWQTHSLVTYIDGITKPIWIAQQYQDEQTGPRGGVVLWEKIPVGVPKRLVLTNGVHATNDIARPDRVAWLDCWIIRRGDGCPGDVADPARRVQIHFETTGSGNDPQFDHVNPPYTSSGFPLPESDWRRYYLRGNGTLTSARPVEGERGRSYVALPAGRPSYLSGPGIADAFGTRSGDLVDAAYTRGYGRADSSAGPDMLTYTLDFGGERAIAGPMTATLWAATTSIDTDFFVQLLDLDPSGNVSYLQRGMLRASFRALDETRSDRVASGPHAGEIFRPYHPFTSPAMLIPRAVAQYQIEIFPVGAVFRPGHKLVLQIYSPPAMDEYFAYGSGQPPAMNTILSDAAHPSSILLPLMATLPPVERSEPACGTQTGVRCVRPLR